MNEGVLKLELRSLDTALNSENLVIITGKTVVLAEKGTVALQVSGTVELVVADMGGGSCPRGRG